MPIRRWYIDRPMVCRAIPFPWPLLVLLSFLACNGGSPVDGKEQQRPLSEYVVKSASEITVPYETHVLIADHGIDSIQYEGSWYGPEATAELCEQLFQEAMARDRSVLFELRFIDDISMDRLMLTAELVARACDRRKGGVDAPGCFMQLSIARPASFAGPLDTATGRSELRLYADGRLELDGNAVGIDTLAQHIASLHLGLIVLKADTQATVGQMKRLMQIGAKAGAKLIMS